MLAPEVIIGIITLGMALAGSLVTVGLVWAKVKTIDVIWHTIERLTDSQQKQSQLLARICDRLEISNHG